MATDTRVKSTQNLSVGTLNATVVFDLRKNSSFSVQLVPSGSIVGSWTVVVYSSNDGVTVGRALSVHATRATFCTWIGALTLPEGLRDRLTRHELGIAERVYTVRDRAELTAAIMQLPCIWPDFPPSNTIIGSSLTDPNADGNLSPVTHGSPIEQRRSLPPAMCDSIHGSGERAHAEGRVEPVGSPSSTLTLISVRDEQQLDAVITVLTAWASRKLGPALPKGATDGDRGERKI